MSDEAIDQSAANETCVGPASDRAGKASSCDGCPNQKACAEGAGRDEDPTAVIQQLLAGGSARSWCSQERAVGKSTASAQLAFSLASQGLAVGLLDVDICGPSIPLMLGLKGHQVRRATGWPPVCGRKMASPRTTRTWSSE